MEWLILILGVPAVLVPLVLLFGFAGCYPAALACSDDRDCPTGTQCFDGSCVGVGDPNEPFLPISPPSNLAAIAIDDHSVSLRWNNTDPAAIDFRIERAPEDGDFAEIPSPAIVSPTGATDASGLQEGVTFIYRVRALLGPEASDSSETSSATVLPAAPVNLVATPVSTDQIDLSWNNASAVATEFSVEHSVPGGVEIFRVAGTTFSQRGLGEGTRHEYRVFAIVVDGVENDVPQEVKSPGAIVSATTFTAAFTAPPGTLTSDQASAAGEGICLVQRFSATLLAPNIAGTQVRLTLRGSNSGSLTIDRITVSKVGNTGDPYDSGPDLTDLAPGGMTTIAAAGTATVGPLNYAFDSNQDLLVAFDISSAANEGNLRFGALNGADTFARAGTAEAGVQDRTPGYINATNNLFLVEKIEVL
jgi:hypothetical protein